MNFGRAITLKYTLTIHFSHLNPQFFTWPLILTEFAMKTSPWKYWLAVPVVDLWTNRCWNNKDMSNAKIALCVLSKSIIFSLALALGCHALSAMCHSHSQVSQHVQVLKSVLWQSLDEIISQWSKEQRQNILHIIYRSFAGGFVIHNAVNPLWKNKLFCVTICSKQVSMILKSNMFSLLQN